MTTSENNTRARPTECFVYIQVPGSLDVLTCGRYVLETRDDGTALGQFIYGRTYRENPRAVELDKFELPLREGTFETVRLRGIFGPLRDASPDAWGRLVLEKILARTDLSELECLLHSPDDRIGALTFGTGREPPARASRFNPIVQLEALVKAAEDLMDGALAANPRLQQRLSELVQPGTSLGGARPKNVVEDDSGLWLAKFPAREDRWNNAPVEAAMLRLAAECGISTATAKAITVAGRHVLLVKRFDRERIDGGYVRHRMVSALTVLQSDDEYLTRTNWSYLRLADELRRWVRDPDADLKELYRRVILNALISNTDDHPRNHALIAPGRDWMLSPAYDLTPIPVVAQEKRDLALEAGVYNRYANRHNLLSASARFRISRDEARAMIDHTKKIVASRWRTLALQCGATEADCAMIAPAFNYPGFEYDPKDVLR